MRKEIVAVEPIDQQGREEGSWLDVERIARVRLTSEDQSSPIENALNLNPARNSLGWRAEGPGAQTVALHFDVPQRIRRIFVQFIEREVERGQEFALRYSSPTETNREIVRQQWTFSPTGSTQETEDYEVDLHSVTKLEILIDPDRGAGHSLATLNALRVA
jgi:hypothetical protein